MHAVISVSSAEQTNALALTSILQGMGVNVVKGDEQVPTPRIVFGTRAAVKDFVNNFGEEGVFISPFANIFLMDMFGHENMVNDSVRLMSLTDIPDDQPYFVKEAINRGQFKARVIDNRGLLKAVWTSTDGTPPPMVMISSPKQIIEEYRVFILDGKIVGGCQYAFCNYMHIRQGLPVHVEKFAEEMNEKYLNYINSLDGRTYVLDIGRVNDHSDRLGVMEVNSFSTAAWMGINLHDFAKAIVEHLR